MTGGSAEPSVKEARELEEREQGKDESARTREQELDLEKKTTKIASPQHLSNSTPMSNAGENAPNMPRCGESQYRFAVK